MRPKTGAGNRYHTAQAGIEAAKRSLNPKTAYNAGLEQYNTGACGVYGRPEKYGDREEKGRSGTEKAKKELDDAKSKLIPKEELEKSKAYWQPQKRTVRRS